MGTAFQGIYRYSPSNLSPSGFADYGAIMG